MDIKKLTVVFMQLPPVTGDRWYIFLIVYHTSSGNFRVVSSVWRVVGLAAMMTTRFVCRLGTLLALLATTAVAQKKAGDWNTVKALSTGTDVRVKTGSRTVSGTIDRVTDDTLTMTSGKGSEMFNQQDVARVSVGKKGHRGRNALIGLGIGTGVGFGIGAAVDHVGSCRGGVGFGCIGLYNPGKVVFTPVGALAGTLVGALIPTGAWREVYEK
jgi:hypothetical protein